MELKGNPNILDFMMFKYFYSDVDWSLLKSVNFAK